MILQILPQTPTAHFLCVSHHAQYFWGLSNVIPVPPYEADTIIVLILQIESMRLKEVK